MQFIFVELDKFDKTAELCQTDLDKLIYTMKSLPNIKEKEEPDFMQEEWLASAIRELDAANLPPEERALLEIAVAREVSSRYAAQQWAEFVEARGEKRGMEQGLQQGKIEGKIEALRQNIRSILSKHPDWSDDAIADLLEVSVDVVAEERQNLRIGQ